jgi:hypothetical protein
LDNYFYQNIEQTDDEFNIIDKIMSGDAPDFYFIPILKNEYPSYNSIKCLLNKYWKTYVKYELNNTCINIIDLYNCCSTSKTVEETLDKINKMKYKIIAPIHEYEKLCNK